MNIEYYRDYCLLKPGVSEGFPFNGNTLVFKVMGKIPALGYDSKAMKLKPFDIPASKLKYKYDPEFVGYVSQALFRNSVVSSTDDLEKRVRKLENTVNRIIAKCCPEAKDK